MLQGQRDLQTVAQQILSELASLVNAHQGVFYTFDDRENPEEPLLLVTSYAGSRDLPVRLRLAETLVGQCALDRRKLVVNDFPEDGWRISMGLAEAKPSHAVVLPVLFEKHVKAVIALSSFKLFSEVHQTFFDQLTELFGIVLNTIAATMRTEDLLKRSQALTTELQQKNAELNEKAEQLQLTSKYKSDFLANMSHELRTPLNSLLILSKMLYQNAEGNLTPKQVEHAKTINLAGSDLLSLINDILDLSKIESGTMSVDAARVRFRDIQDEVEASFRPVALSKKLDFEIDTDAGLPATFESDAKRVQQVLPNLLSNSFKFTSEGSVQLHIGVATNGWTRDHEILSRSEKVISFSVKDTGIGISPAKYQVIFEPFQQADTSTSRKYGGTGLGLSISREVAKLLGGEIKLESTPGQGSTFTLYLPDRYVPVRPKALKEVAAIPVREALEEAKPAMAQEAILELLPTDVQDDRENLRPGDQILLIVEDDISFATLLLDLAREQGFKGLLAFTGEAALAMARKSRLQAISLGLRLPDMEGYTLLDYLKHTLDLRHIPVVVLSGGDDPGRALRAGAFAYLKKPAEKEDLVEALLKTQTFISRQPKSLLIVEDSDIERQSLIDLLTGEDVVTETAGTAAEALKMLKSKPLDCLVLDLMLPDMGGIELVERIKSEVGLLQLPIIVHTAKDLSQDEGANLSSLTSAVVVKDATSPERILEQVSLFLHRPFAVLGPQLRKMLESVAEKGPALAGKTVLVVDDDMRNIYALSSVLEMSQMKVVCAQDGKKALEELVASPAIDLVLMDIMMPEMDGYQALREIAKLERFDFLPIIAVTAKAMPGDRERCIDAGASDYISKPVDPARLLSLLRVWLHPKTVN